MPDASEADPYAAACLYARRRGWKVRLSIEKEVDTQSRLHRITFVDAKGDVQGWAAVDETLADAARELLRSVARSGG